MVAAGLIPVQEPQALPCEPFSPPSPSPCCSARLPRRRKNAYSSSLTTPTATASAAYCKSKEFAQATSYRQVDKDEITGAIPTNAGACKGGSCDQFVAIERKSVV